MASKTIIPFRMGDVCYVKKGVFKGENIIQECSMDGPQRFEYSTNRGAWITHKELQLVKPADKQSLTLLWKSIDDEGEDEEGEWA